MATQPSTKRYYGFATQTAKGTAAAAPTLVVPAVKSQSRFWWNANIQDEKYATGDLFVLVDGLPVKPSAAGVVVLPFKPSVLNPVLANCCFANGDLIAPVYSTWFVGDGYNEKIYKDVLFTNGEMRVDNNTGPALWTLNMLGLSIPAVGTARTTTAIQALFPVYERSYRYEDLQHATILGTARDNLEQVIWRINAGVTAYFGSKGDGTDGPSDLIVNELGAEMDFTIASESDAIRAAYVTACGAPGDFITAFLTSCGTAHGHSFELDRGLIITDQQDAPDDMPINEPVTVRGLRSAAVGHPSPAKIVIT